MSSRHRTGTVAAVVAPALFVVVAVLVVPLAAFQKNRQKLDKAQLEEAQVVSGAIDAAQSGGAPPADLPVSIESYHFFKTATGQTYVPFTLVVDSSALSDPAVTLLFRAVRKGAVPQPAETKDGKALAPAYQDLEFLTIGVDGGSKARLSRAFQVPAGAYDLYIAVKERNPAAKQKPKIGVTSQEINAPDLSADGLVTSSVIVSDKVETLQAPLKPEQQRENPYTLGLMRLFPRSGTTFARNQELAVYFQIYNPALDGARKPDVLIEYAFYQKQAGTERNIFNDEPSRLDAGSLPPDFDVTKSNLANGRAWPLDKFPSGDYRLQVKVTDRISGKVVTNNVSFSVA